MVDPAVVLSDTSSNNDNTNNNDNDSNNNNMSHDNENYNNDSIITDENNERDTGSMDEIPSSHNGGKNVLRRVKLYYLNDDGKWDDKGTGHVSCEYVKAKEDMCLLMISEADDSRILESKIAQDDIYQLQGDSLIVWCDAETSLDMAISFQESSGCQQVWDEIRTIQGRDPDSKDVVARNLEEASKENTAEDEDAYDHIAPLELPDPELGNLHKIYQLMHECSGVALMKAIMEPDFLDKYFDVFDRAEEANDLESLRILFQIFKLFISLDEISLLQRLFHKDNMLRLMGVLEYDPSLPVSKANHRDYLQRVVVYREVIPFSDRSIVDNIHQTFRIQYLKDTVLPRALDDATFATLNQMIQTNNATIVAAISSDESFMKNLFALINSPDTRVSELRSGVKFLHEYNSLLKSVPGSLKNDVYTSLMQNGLVEMIQSKLRHTDVVVRHICAELLSSVLTNNTQMLREYIAEHKSVSLLESIVRGIVDETELGIQDTLTEVLKMILDPYIIRDEKITYTTLDLFYNEPIYLLVDPFVHPDQYSTSSQIHALDILSFIVENNGYRSKNFIIKHDVMKKAMVLLDTAVHKDLILAVIRFFRTCVSLCDIFYNNNILRHNLFKHVMKVWRENANKYNLINSAIIHLFEFVLKENIKRLLGHVVAQYRSDFEKVDYVETFQLLISQHAQNEEADQSSRDVTHLPADLEKEEQEEESYFEESDTEQAASSPKTDAASDTAITTNSSSNESHTADESNDKSEERNDQEEDDELFFKSLARSKKSEEDDTDDDFFASTDQINQTSSTTENEPKNNKAHTIRINISGSETMNETEANGQGLNGELDTTSSPTSTSQKLSELSPKKRTQDSLSKNSEGDMLSEDEDQGHNSPLKRRKLSPAHSISQSTELNGDISSVTVADENKNSS